MLSQCRRHVSCLLLIFVTLVTTAVPDPGLGLVSPVGGCRVVAAAAAECCGGHQQTLCDRLG